MNSLKTEPRGLSSRINKHAYAFETFHCSTLESIGSNNVDGIMYE